MLKKVILAVALLLVAGCNMISGADKGIRVVEYGGGVVAPLTGQAGGVAVHSWGEVETESVICRKNDAGMVAVWVAGVSPATIESLCGPGHVSD